ncbi:NAD-dependent epimerase/dehydratase family protein [Leptothrix discophora]|uniref:NAD-dependent epimerase/dehydratase family protein n=1 Tax=Leptothrix discophora TaxID=89 RepID=A0ABT9G1X5_LEPDI|nr:NAD-dependent epimerase/dehydratase family protein [Leptothrix discophora]MDP4300458.1 NAD-dependent epimerase/dehydratase family protein [Leptothrix discophora]
MKVLITGVAGFIGMHVASALLAHGDEVVGVDALDDPFDVALTYARLARIQAHPRFRFSRLDISDRPAVDNCFHAGGFDAVVHLATQQGGAERDGGGPARVHLAGFVNVLEGCRQHGVPHLVYASTSDINCERRARGSTRVGRQDDLRHDKRAGETLARSYSRLHGVATTGLRFFTVYGPWGRPDIGYQGLTRGLLTGEPLPVYPREGEIGHGLTYVDDIVEGIERALHKPSPPEAGLLPGEAPSRVLNIGSHDPVRLLDFIAALELALGRASDMKVMPVTGTEGGEARSSTEERVVHAGDFLGEQRVTMPLAEGVQRFVHWYLAYHGMDPARSTSALRRAAVFEDPLAVQWLPPRQQTMSLSRRVEAQGLRVL